MVAGLSGSGGDQGYVDGMKLALDEVNSAGGVAGRQIALAVQDHGGSPTSATRLIGDIVSKRSGRPAAILYAGSGPALSPLRAEFEQAGTPLVLLEGDLYTSRGLFRQVFQTTIPWEWQALVIARYLVVDRKAQDIVFVGVGPEARTAQGSLRGALAYWGGRLAQGFTEDSADDRAGLAAAFDRAARADAAVVFGPPGEALELSNAIEELAPEPGLRPRIAGSAGLLADSEGLAPPEPGTTACYTYTWAGWADPIPRVGRFRERFRAAFGRDPASLEQEGYDAVRLLAAALARTGGSGGSKLTAALENTDDRTFSSFPIDLGPDDHLFQPRDELGLFAVAGPDERVDPWQVPGSRPWRALMRTFTYDGERTNVLDRDRRVFFPFWRKNQPGPKFFRSRYGIRSRPSRDLLH
ncbi:MAG: ABC transporter substrate-binding protein [Actinomycetota bacterium]